MYPSMLQKLIRTVGWGWAIRAVGFINFGLIAFAYVTVKTRLPPRPAGKFLDFAVFFGQANLGYTLYVAGAATVWLGASSPSVFLGVRALSASMGQLELTLRSHRPLHALVLLGAVRARQQRVRGHRLLLAVDPQRRLGLWPHDPDRAPCPRPLSSRAARQLTCRSS